jgi:hypothetical protein
LDPICNIMDYWRECCNNVYYEKKNDSRLDKPFDSTET